MINNHQMAHVGVIGAGWWSTYTHIPGLLNNPNAELVAIADSSPEALARCLAKYPGPSAYTNYAEMLQNEYLQGVVIAVPHAHHYDIACACLKADLHVMLEKPMVLTAIDAHNLIDLAQERKRELIIGYPYHFAPAPIRARELITSGELGPVQCISCLFASPVIEFYRGNEAAYATQFNYPVTGPGTIYADPVLSGGGQGHLQVTHSAALAMFVSELRVERVSAHMNNFGLPVDLVNAINVQFEGGAVGTFTSTGNISRGDRGQLELRVYCEKGYLLLDAIDGTLRYRNHTDQAEHTFRTEDPDLSYPRFATAGNLVDVCRGEATNGSPAQIGRSSVEILDAAYRSAATKGKSVALAELYGVN